MKIYLIIRLELKICVIVGIEMDCTPISQSYRRFSGNVLTENSRCENIFVKFFSATLSLQTMSCPQQERGDKNQINDTKSISIDKE